MPDSTRRPRSGGSEEWDVGAILFLLLLLAVVSAWALGTHDGNQFMCRHGYAPTFIDCSKVTHA
jgi:hypothetical protein